MKMFGKFDKDGKTTLLMKHSVIGEVTTDDKQHIQLALSLRYAPVVMFSDNTEVLIEWDEIIEMALRFKKLNETKTVKNSVYVLSMVDFSYKNGDVLNTIIGIFRTEVEAQRELEKIKKQELLNYRPIIINGEELANTDDEDDNRVCVEMETSKNELFIDFGDDGFTGSEYIQYRIIEKELL